MKKFFLIIITIIFIGILYFSLSENIYSLNENNEYNSNNTSVSETNADKSNIESNIAYTNSLEETENSYPTESIKADNVIIEDFITSYERIYIQAINKNRFYLLIDFFEKDSELYNSQMQIISNYNEEEIKVELLRIDINEIIQENEQSYSVKVLVEYKLTSPKGIETKVFNRQYAINYKDDKFIITDIKEFDQ